MQLSQTNPRDALCHGKHAAKVDAQCDKQVKVISRTRLTTLGGRKHIKIRIVTLVFMRSSCT